MKLMPAASARSSIACVVASSAPALCIIDLSSASPNVMPPRHSADTFTPAAPRFRYCIGETYHRARVVAMNAVEAARAHGWRRVYFNALTIPFWGVHVLAIVGLATLGASWSGVALCATLYLVRMFFVTGAYHRYFSHRSYKTSRWFQFVLALGATMTAQKGVLWWAAHHRTHHKFSDERGDLHSAMRDRFWRSHMGC